MLDSLEIVDLRNIARARLADLSGVNFILGDNGAGKSSMLEGIHYLGRGRSFRTANPRRLIRSGSACFRVVASVTDGEGGKITLGLERNAEHFTVRLAGQPARALADLAARAPVLLLDSHTHRLLEEGPAGRRRFMDWGVFQGDPAFLDHWQRFRLALRHRNAALRSGQTGAALRAWSRELVPAAEGIDSARHRYLRALEVELAGSAESLLEGARIALEYRRGWNREESLADVLDSGEARDQELGYTAQGPHRADFTVRKDSHRASDRLSAGEQKMLVAAWC